MGGRSDRRVRLMAVATGLLMIATACGGTDNPEPASDSTTTSTASTPTSVVSAPPTTTSATADSTTTAATDTPTAGIVVGEAGSYTVNEVEYVVTLLNRCVPFFDVEGNLDLQAISGPASVKLNLTLLGDEVDVSVDGSGLREPFGSAAFGGDPVVHRSEVAGDRWTGAATVGDALRGGTTVELVWDVMIPAEAGDCSLG